MRANVRGAQRRAVSLVASLSGGKTSGHIGHASHMCKPTWTHGAVALFCKQPLLASTDQIANPPRAETRASSTVALT